MQRKWGWLCSFQYSFVRSLLHWIGNCNTQEGWLPLQVIMVKVFTTWGVGKMSAILTVWLKQSGWLGSWSMTRVSLAMWWCRYKQLWSRPCAYKALIWSSFLTLPIPSSSSSFKLLILQLYSQASHHHLQIHQWYFHNLLGIFHLKLKLYIFLLQLVKYVLFTR